MNLLNQPQKLFIIIISTGFIALFALSHFALKPLYDAGIDPKMAAEEYTRLSNWFDKGTLVIYVLLIFISNLIYRNNGKGIYLFYGWVFFSVITMFSYAYMAEEYFHFKKNNDLWMGETSLSFLGGAFLCLIAATAAFINYAVLKRVIQK